MTGAVLKYDAACRAIAEANTVDEVTDWIDKAAAVKEYGRRINNRQIEIDAIEIRVKAKRRRGEIVAEMKARGQIRRGQPKKEMSPGDDISFSLEDLGISRNESSEDQRLAAIPGDSFARLVARCRDHAEKHPEKHSFDVLGENAGLDKKAARDNRERVLGAIQLALPDKKFGVILADPEWRFVTYSRETGMDRAADNHYPTSETDEICARPVGDIAADDAVLFLWATAPMLPDALRVMAAWGFAYKAQCIWKKDRIGTGYWFRNQHELLLVGTKGKIPAPAMGTQFSSVIEAPIGKHSEKPDVFYDLIEGYFPTLPKIELNARRARQGWEAWGQEAPLPAHDPETGEVIEDAAPVDDDPAQADIEAQRAADAAVDLCGMPDGDVERAAETMADLAERLAPLPDLSEFDQLKAFSDFCFPRRSEILAAIAPDYIARGLAYSTRASGNPDWGLSEPGWKRFYHLEAERRAAAAAAAAVAAGDAVPEIVDGMLQSRMPLDGDELAQQTALIAIENGKTIDGDLARHLIGLGHVHATTTHLVVTDEGRAWCSRLVAPAAVRYSPPPALPLFLAAKEAAE